MSNRVFLHVDMDAFYASVEQHDNPELKGKPVVVGASPDQRGVVAAASYEARRFGIRSAMPSSEAGRRCPDAVFLPVRMARYKEVSKVVFDQFEDITPMVEPLSIDEAFLDVSGAVRLFGPGPVIAREVKARIKHATGLTASVGVAPNKFLAKLASDLEKPDGLTVVPSSRDAIVKFLAPLSVTRIWGIGPVTAADMLKLGIETIGDLQSFDERILADRIGTTRVEHLQKLAHGYDPRDIELEHEAKSISREHTFPRDCKSRQKVERVLLDLVEDVGRSLRESDRHAGLARLKLRFKGFHTITRQRRLSPPCRDDITLRETALAILQDEDPRKPVRLIGFGVAEFAGEGEAEQLSLFDTTSLDRTKRERLSSAVDDIRARFGDNSIGRADAE